MNTDIFIYKYYFNGQKKLLGAWSKFTIVGSIRGMKFIRSVLFILVVKNGKSEMIKLNLQDAPIDTMGYNTNLDMRVYTNLVAGSSSNTFTMPYIPQTGDELEAYTTDGVKLPISYTAGSASVTFNSAIPTTQGTYTYDTDTNNIATSTSTSTEQRTPLFIGLKYNMKYTFSELVFKAASGQSKTPSNAAKLMIRNGSLFYNDTASFKVSVTPKQRDTQTSAFSPTIIGSSTIGELTLEDGAFRFPIFCSSEDAKITIENDSALPSNFQSAEFEAFTHGRSSRYG
jgi:hypothetical protein